VLSEHRLIVQDEKINAVQPEKVLEQKSSDKIVTLDGKWIAPGMIDLHVHGSLGADTMDCSPEGWDRICRFFASRGVTSFLLTTGAASREAIDEVIETFQGYHPPQDGALPLGIHLEGPYLSPQKKGVQPEEHLRNPDPGEYLPWFESGAVRLMTAAPELSGTLEMIRAGRERGVFFAAGHTTASYDRLLEAVGIGLNQVSHTFNAMESLHHRSPGALGAALSDDRIYTQVIADGVHLHPAVVKILVRSKGPGRTILITDAMRAAGLGDGRYELLGQEIEVAGGEARTREGTLAGSILTLDQGLRNVLRFSGVTLSQGIAMASESPARALDLYPERGALKAGSRADLVILDEDFQVTSVMIGGRMFSW
jgi:N-acetylglucosamine-6-phosphate deacetylase